MYATSLSLLISLSMSFSAHALQIVRAGLDATNENIVVDVAHGGGCGKHEYKLVLGGCRETFPVSCDAKIKHITSDSCEAFISGKAVFNLKEYGLDASYYENGSITFNGDQGSSATVVLSKKASYSVSCTTHTGSDLQISDKKIKLTPVGQQSVEIAVTAKEILVLESFPPIYQSEYKLEDGRSLVVSFMDEATIGKGYFIRLDGSISPKFECSQK